MRQALQQLFDHLRWADQQALGALRAAGDPPRRAVEVYAHLLAAEHVWLCRLQRVPPALAVWPALTLDECARLAATNAAALRALLDALDEQQLAAPVPYTNSAGQAFQSSALDILLHVAMHGSHHRGQVALLLRDAGAEPAPTDYIGFVRGVPAPARPV